MQTRRIIHRHNCVVTMAIILAVGVSATFASPLGTEITYQGRLNDGGAPANGDYDFVFQLFDAETNGNQVGDLVLIEDWPVVDGLFTIPVDFGASAFGGEQRWIDIMVRPGAGGAHTPLTPRQPITAAPVAQYALSAPGGAGHWAASGDDIYNINAGAVGIGTSSPAYPLDASSDGSRVINGLATAASGITEGIYGQADSPQGTGVHGFGMAGTGLAVGVRGQTNSVDGRAMWGQANATSGNNYGGLFSSNSISGTGVLGINNAATGITYGVTGQCSSEDGIAVMGRAQASSGVNRGIYGLTNSESGFAGYFEGGKNYFEGRVGIGTTSPLRELQVMGVARVGSTSTFVEFDGDEGDAILRQNDNFGPTLQFLNYSGSSNSVTGSITFDDAGGRRASIEYVQPTIGSDGLQISGPSDVHLKVTDDGNVGIGTTSPSARLHVFNDDTTRPMYIQSTHPTTGLSALRVDLASSASGNATIAGVNTGAGRAGLFQINNSGNSADAVEGTTNGNGSGVYGFSAMGAGVTGVSENANGYGGIFGSLITNGKGLFVVGESHLIDSVAIGTTTIPSGVKLNVAGTTRTNVLEITGADVAEKFPTSEMNAIEPGTVMEIDPNTTGKLRIARGAYNRRVAGVTSGAGDIPVGAILGNLPGSGGSPVIALNGRVWVKCDASRHAISVGDLLTTSATVGHAMAVRDHDRAHGAVIGKAMSALAKGESGLVLVLVNLQ